MPGGGFDQRGGALPPIKALDPLPLAARPDVVVFQTEPLESELEITGISTDWQ
jgi:predicted acyl esterase